MGKGVYVWKDHVLEFLISEKNRPVANTILNNGSRGAAEIRRLLHQLYSRWHTKYGR